MAVWLDRAVNVLENALGLGLIATVLFCFVSVIARYIFATSILAADEIQVFYLAMMTFLGSIAVTFRDGHLRMSLLVDLAGPAPRRAVATFEAAVTVLVTCYVGYQSYSYAASMYRFGRRAEMSDIPTWIIHASLCAGFAAVALLALGRLVLTIAGKQDSAPSNPVETAR